MEVPLGEDKKNKKRKIKKEIKRFGEIYKDCDKNTLDFAKSLIENAAFMTVTLQELMEEINTTGTTTEYKNGENQYGQKKSPAVETYNTMVKNHATVMKQLEALLPRPEDWEKPGDKEEEDGFEEFVETR